MVMKSLLSQVENLTIDVSNNGQQALDKVMQNSVKE